MTIDEAIEHAEEVEKENRRRSKRYDDASGYSRSGNKDIRTNDAKKCEKCAEEHRQIAEWLKDYKRLSEQEPKTGHCKDCKHWKDSDGVYRRGVGAESKCPINNVSVNHGLGYCYMFEPQERSEKA